MTRHAVRLVLAASMLVPACAKRSPAPGSMAASPMEAGGAMAAADYGGDAEMPIADDEGDDGFDRSLQAGTLTAGVFDDTLNPDVFAAFAHDMEASELGDVARRIGTIPLTTVRVVDRDGAPVAGARVDAGRPLVTGTDGRVVITGWDAQPSSDGTLHVTVQHRGQTMQGDVEIGAHGTELRLPVRAATKVEALDIALVIDATGSMGDELEYLKVELRGIARRIERDFPQVDQRFALVVYRDEGDEYVTRHFDFTSDLAAFERRLGRQRADGGGDYPEAMDAALVDAAAMSWRDGADVARVAFVVADAPPHPERATAALAAADELRTQGVGIYPVAASGVAAEAELVMRAAAAMSGGEYIFVTDDSGVGLAHAEPHVPCYTVERLRDAMTRVIGSELAGRRLEADPSRAIRSVGRGQGGVCEVPSLRVAS